MTTLTWKNVAAAVDQILIVVVVRKILVWWHFWTMLNVT
jgi:hypothetical protein